MLIGSLVLHLTLFESATLKDRRSLVRSLTDRVRQRFNVAVADVGPTDDPGHAEIGIVCVSNEARHAHAMLMRVLDFVEDLPLDAEIQDVQTTVGPAF